jgi:DNA-binding Lrp family transcriptional regulator
VFHAWLGLELNFTAAAYEGSISFLSQFRPTDYGGGKMGETAKEEACPRIEAFVLVTTKPGALWNVVEEARKVTGVKLARPLAGRFDVLIEINTNNLSWVIARIHDIKGITKTETLVSLEARFGTEY